jgi:hypothetical protein
MAQLLEAVQRFRKIEEATSTRDEPAPGARPRAPLGPAGPPARRDLTPPRPAVYLLDEIVELARSSPDSAQGVADHVVKRLGNKSPVVKFKVRAARRRGRDRAAQRAPRLTPAGPARRR